MSEITNNLALLLPVIILEFILAITALIHVIKHPTTDLEIKLYG